MLRPVQNSTYTGLSATQEKSKFEHASGNIEAQTMASSLVSKNKKGRFKMFRDVARSVPGVANTDPPRIRKTHKHVCIIGEGSIVP